MAGNRRWLHGVALLLLVALLPVAGGAAPDRIMRRAMRVFEPVAEAPAPDALADLGRRLFHDRALSAAGNRSCAGCHPLAGGAPGADGLATSTGAHGNPLRRNTPSVYNVALAEHYYWDGRSDDLEAMLAEHLRDPAMLGTGASGALERALEAQSVSGGVPGAAQALAAFLRTLVTPSRFDAYLAGDASALDAVEREGLALYLKTSCDKCHDGAGLGGQSREKLGEFGSYANQTDLGLHEHTGDEVDRMVFKAPVLRNVALTAPYFHDGRVATLEEAVRLMARLQQDVELSEEQVRAIVAFLGSLSGRTLK